MLAGEDAGTPNTAVGHGGNEAQGIRLATPRQRRLRHAADAADFDAGLQIRIIFDTNTLPPISLRPSSASKASGSCKSAELKIT